jgi:hypothetical protein
MADAIQRGITVQAADLVAGGEIRVGARKGVERSGADPASAQLLRCDAKEATNVRACTYDSDLRLIGFVFSKSTANCMLATSIVCNRRQHSSACQRFRCVLLRLLMSDAMVHRSYMQAAIQLGPLKWPMDSMSNHPCTGGQTSML